MKPPPIVDPGTEPYWDGLKLGQFLLKRCRACGKAHFYPRELCPHCHSEDLEWSEASGKGTIYSFTVAHRPAGPAFAADAPYTIAIVELAEGPRMMTWIIGAGEDIRIGAAVGVKFVDVDSETVLPMFEMRAA